MRSFYGKAIRYMNAVQSLNDESHLPINDIGGWLFTMQYELCIKTRKLVLLSPKAPLVPFSQLFSQPITPSQNINKHIYPNAAITSSSTIASILSGHMSPITAPNVKASIVSPIDFTAFGTHIFTTCHHLSAGQF